MRETYKGTSSDDHISGIRKETRSRILSLLIISKVKNNLRYCQQLTKEFCSNSADPCTMSSGEKGTIELWVFGGMR